MRTRDEGKNRRLLAPLLLTAPILVAGACGGEQELVTVPLSRLVGEQESYEGREVETRGTVRVFGEEAATGHYVVEDARANRVQVVPGSVAAKYVGREVIVAGEFDFDDTRGRFIRMGRIRSAG